MIQCHSQLECCSLPHPESGDNFFQSLFKATKVVNRNGKLDKLSCDLLFTVIYHKMDWMARREDNCGLDLHLRTAGKQLGIA